MEAVPQGVEIDEAEDEQEEPEGEEDGAEPIAKHGWDDNAPRKDAMPEAGPEGHASQTAGTQASLHHP
jgi:hypothetical protein